MQRTQIYLPQQQHDWLKASALKQKTSMSSVIRQLVDEKARTGNIASGKAKVNTGEWLLSQAKLIEKMNFQGPSDLASHVDEYLYDR